MDSGKKQLLCNDLNLLCNSLDEMKEAINKIFEENDISIIEIQYKDNLSASSAESEKGLYFPDPGGIMTLLDKKNYILEAERNEETKIHTAFIKLSKSNYKKDLALDTNDTNTLLEQGLKDAAEGKLLIRDSYAEFAEVELEDEPPF